MYNIIKIVTLVYYTILSTYYKINMNSLKNIFRPVKPISKNISFKPDELVSNSQKVCVELFILYNIFINLYITNEIVYFS